MIRLLVLAAPLLLTTSGAPPGPALGRQADEPGPAFTTLVVEMEVVQPFAGADAVRKTLYLDRAGARSAVLFESARDAKLQVVDGRWSYEIDLKARTGTKHWLSRFLAASEAGGATADALTAGGAEHRGTEEIAGVSCERWVREDEVSTSTTWVWNGVALGSEVQMGRMRSGERAVRVEVDPDLPEERFRVPEDVVLTEESWPGLELLRALEADPAPPEAPLPGDELARDAGADVAPVAPTVEPFRSSRFWEPLLGTSLDVDRSVTLIAIQLHAIEAGRNAAAALRPSSDRAGPSARLEPEVPDGERVWWMLVPRIVDALAPLFAAESWTDEQLALAREAERFLALKSHGPGVRLAASSVAGRRAGLATLARWFQEQIAHPELYAAMLCTMDYGPYVGLPYEVDAPAPAKQAVSLGEGRELRLCDVGGREPFVLQCIAGDELVWSRRISDAPNRTVSEVRLLEEPPLRLGAHGWKVRLFVRWENGGEHAHLYLDGEAGFLFYFMGW